MAGLFERMGLVRTEYEGMPEIPMQPVSEPMYAPETPVIDAAQVSYDDVIASIYQQGDIDDENSIFKIKAYIDILPQDMTKAKKQASIAGILSVNGINVDDLIEAVYRLSANDTNKAFYYIGSGSPRILKEYLFRIGELAGCADKVGVGIRPDDGIKYSMEMFDNSDLVATVGEYVSTDFDNGINKTIDWLKTL